MPKKIIKTTEELTEEFFALERREYEKRVPAAFPRVPVARLTGSAELPELPDLPVEEPEAPELPELPELPESSEAELPPVKGGK